MNILSADDISKRFGEKDILTNVSFGIDRSDRIALVGVNGTGKSTLLKMVAGLEQPDSGSMTSGGHVRIHYLPQEPAFESGSNVLEQVFFGELPVMKALRQYEDTLLRLQKEPNSEALQSKLIRLQGELDALGAFDLEHEAKAILTKLGIDYFDADVSTLSGGQRKRVAMARALILPSELLILDEPTNHIDHDSVEWLASTLLNRDGALFMVTHDRYFLDRVATRIFELDRGQLYQYPGQYEAYVEMKMAREAMARASEDKRKNFLRNEIEWIKRGPQGRGTKQKARTERYYEVLDAPSQTAQGSVDISTASTRLGKSVVELEHVSKGYDGQTLIRDFSHIIVPQDRIGIVGHNGTGKSTLIKMIAGQVEPDSGTVKIGKTVKVGYFAQETTDMNTDMRVLEYVRQEAEYVETADGETITAAQMLERFLFTGSLQWTPVSKLSGGERRRLVLLRMLLSAPNVLLLDEPTNDLDITTLAILEDYLDEFPGVVVAVSHDRYFLNRVSTKIISFEGTGRLSVVNGNFADYVAWRAQTHEADSVSEDLSAETEKVQHTHQRDHDKIKFSFAEKKEYEEIEAQIASLEQELADVQQEMGQCGSDYVKLQALSEREASLIRELDNRIQRWAYLNELAEKIEQQS